MSNIDCPVSGINIRAWLYVHSQSSASDFLVYFCFSSCVRSEAGFTLQINKMASKS